MSGSVASIDRTFSATIGWSSMSRTVTGRSARPRLSGCAVVMSVSPVRLLGGLRESHCSGGGGGASTRGVRPRAVDAGASRPLRWPQRPAVLPGLGGAVMTSKLDALIGYLDELSGRADLGELARRLRRLDLARADVAGWVRFSPRGYQRNLVRAGEWYHL